MLGEQVLDELQQQGRCGWDWLELHLLLLLVWSTQRNQRTVVALRSQPLDVVALIELVRCVA